MGKKIELLTALDCKTLGDGKHADGLGLSLIVRGASRAWTLRYTAPDGRQREIGLGALADVGLKAARDAAAEMRDKVRRGIDPLAERAAQRAAAEAERIRKKSEVLAERATLLRVVRDYHAAHVEPKRSTKHAAQWIASIEAHIAAKILEKPITDVEASELLDALTPLYLKVPETARRIRQRLEVAFDWAIVRKLAKENPARVIASQLRQQRDAGNFRALPFGEVAELVKRLRQQTGTAARALEFLILTAARTGEVLGMTWDEISPAGDVWTVPGARMKAGEPHVVYLSDEARAVLARVHGLSDNYVFRSPTGDKPMSEMALLMQLERLGMRERTTVHGLRASFSTWAYEGDKARTDVIEATLAHSEGNKVKAAYNRAQFAEDRKKLLAEWARFAGPIAMADVIRFKAA
jgi:integrase